MKGTYSVKFPEENSAKYRKYTGKFAIHKKKCELGLADLSVWIKVFSNNHILKSGNVNKDASTHTRCI